MNETFLGLTLLNSFPREGMETHGLAIPNINTVVLLNSFPREGMETYIPESLGSSSLNAFELMSPRGDGNTNGCSSTCEIRLLNSFPREGMETFGLLIPNRQ